MKIDRSNRLEPVQGLPFKLATTSFIFPGRIIPNVKKLGAVFDEIELLVFESRPFILNGGEQVEVLPSIDEIKELVELSHLLDVTYNIHLPVDISMTDISETTRHSAVDTVKRVVELCEPLHPTTHTLHLDYTLHFDDTPTSHLDHMPHPDLCRDSQFRDKQYDDEIKRWCDRTLKNLEHLTASLSDPALISIETLNYPFEFLDGMIDACGMSVCVDAGHLIKYNFSIDTVFEKYRDKIPLIHLHGVDFSQPFAPKDHQSLDKTPPDRFASTLNILKQFTGVVSVEVFNYGDLSASLKYLGALVPELQLN